MKFGILTVSDRSTSGVREDLSGPVLARSVQESGWLVSQTAVVPDDFQAIVDVLTSWSDNGLCSVILTTGGVGFSPRDITPEATRAVIERDAPGLAEAMRAGSLQITPHAMLSRAVAGIRKKTLIINLPGNSKGALENFRLVVPVLVHAIQLLEDDEQGELGHHPGRAM
ncbi:MAG TPA: MogA/MoaB family molybdenum cofactor biosynthesis protein [Chloroflexi bacterium]|nr:MAG: molybdenum cofactor biosynthesis protein [Chloroflexota bacterium]HDD55220.1 MogA/MoaB family molybdenum cofactor biosynthesis protein [Chloroflexota bacterium]